MAKVDNSDSRKVMELIRKVRTLAERGENGERDNAKVKLRELMEKYQITKFEESKKKKRSFKLADFNDCKTIMVHCILDTVAKAKIDGSLQKRELYCNMTDVQYIEVCEKFNHYYPEFHRQREAFVKAFILKNDLGIVDSQSGEENDSDSVSDIANIIGSVKPSSYKSRKGLSPSEN